MEQRVIAEMDDRIEEISPNPRQDRRGQPSGFTDREGRSRIDDKHSRAVAYWRQRDWAKGQAECFCRALDALEEAWIVFAESGDPDRALWRIVDAAGFLAEAFPEERKAANGTGYRIEKVAPGSGKEHRWEGRS